MVLFDDNNTDGESCTTWSIQNISYCTQKYDEVLESPSFILDGKYKCKLLLYPRGCKTIDNSFNCFVHGFQLQEYLGEKNVENVKVHYILSFCPQRGQFKKMANSTFDVPLNRQIIQRPIIKREELYKKGLVDTYLDDDTLTIRWRVSKVDEKIMESQQKYARTIISVERANNTFALEKFQEKVIKELISPEGSSFDMNFKLIKGDTFTGGRIKLDITKSDNDKVCFATCNINLLEDGDIVYSMRDEHWFEKTQVPEVWTLPFIPLNELFDSKKLFLRYELAVSDGIDYSRVERIENGKIENESETKYQCSDQPKQSNVLLKDDLFRLYSDGKISDFIIRTPSKDFPVHKAILCARSEVFAAMFEQDMKENRNCFMEIGDIDDDTLSKALMFAYTDVVEGLDFEAASKLYFAADKYDIKGLKMKCSDFLKENLNSLNACEVLFLADLHSDEDLESFVRNFIVDNAAEVLESENWKKFMKDQVNLASEIMHIVCMRKLKINVAI